MDVFLSYNRRDAVHAIALNDWLTGQGMRTFFDERDLGAGQSWMSDLERRIAHEVRAVAVLVGAAGMGNIQQYEQQLALVRQAAEPGFPVIPVILPGTPDWRVPRGFLGLQTWVNFATSTHLRQNPVGLQRLLAAIRRDPTDGDDTRGLICPYKGLAFFEEADSAVFFGRDAEAKALLETVTQHQVAALIGRSGSGKSSLVRAGLLPLLRRRPGFVWDSLVIRPSEEPLLALADALSPQRAEEDPLDRRRRLMAQAAALRQDPPEVVVGTLRDRLANARLRADRLLVVVDQAEEVFSQPWRLTKAKDIRQFHDDAERFARLLLEAVAQGPVSLVLTIRSDFFDPLMHSPFATLLQEAQVHLGRIADLHPCIERPAAVVGLRLAPGLADRIVEEVGPEEANLPLLEHALERMWQQRPHGPVLTADDYDAGGRVSLAINRAAADCYAALRTAHERDAVRRLFLRLVRPGLGSSAPGRVRAVVPEDPAERHVMDLFARQDRRLLIVGEQAGVPVVEVAHEALVRGWETLRGWVAESREKLRVRDAVTDWRASAEEGELIPPGSALLQRARDLLADPGDVRLDADIATYMRRSIAAVDAAAQTEQQRRRRVFGIVAVAAVFFAVLSVTTGWFLRQSTLQTQSVEKELALAGTSVMETQRDLAISQDKFGDARVAQGDLKEALAAYHRGLEIRETLAKRDPDNTELRRDLAVSYSKISNVLKAQGDHDLPISNHDLPISNQVSKGFEQLGSKEPATRLVGIYALEGVLNTSEQYHQPVLEALCAFVRDGTSGMIVGERPATDIQAALTVIGRREARKSDRVDLTTARIAGANLSSADLNGADLYRADLSRADLSRANLNGANLIAADLNGANLSSAALSRAALSRANLIYADLSNADLSNADLSNADLNDADLNGADLSRANLNGAKDLTQAPLEEACGKPGALPPGLTLDKPCPK